MTSPAPAAKPSFADRARKFLIAAAGVAAMVVATGALEEDVEIWVNAALGVLTALGVYQVPNKRALTHNDNLRA